MDDRARDAGQVGPTDGNRSYSQLVMNRSKNWWPLSCVQMGCTQRSGVRLFGLMALILMGSLGWAQDSSNSAVPPSRQAENVVIIRMDTGDGMIDTVTAKSFIRRLKIAEQSGADAFVIEINTPGGQVGAVLEICGAIKASSIENSAAWINTQAYSGGAIIALACKEIITSDPAAMGDALPIYVDPFDGLQTLPPLERGKLMIPLISEVIDSARRRNKTEYVYDEYLVQGIITGVELWWVQSNQTGQRIAINREEYRLIFGSAPIGSPPRLGSASPGETPSVDQTEIPVPDGMQGVPGQSTEVQPASPALGAITGSAASQQEFASKRPTITAADQGQWTLIEKISDGSAPLLFREGDMRHFQFSSNDSPIKTVEDVQAWYGASKVRSLDPLWSEGLVRFMTSMYVRGLLVVLLLLAIFISMIHPGMIVPESIAVLALCALLIPPFIIGMANWWEIVAILGGIALIGVEIFIFPGFGLPGIAGLLMLFVGLVGTFLPDQGSGLFPDSPNEQRDLMFAVLTVLLATTTAFAGMWFISRRFGTLPLFRHMILDAPGTSGDLLLAMEGAEAGPAVIGETGTTRSVLRPVGRVELADGRVIDGTAESGYIEADRPVRVVEVTGVSTIVAEDKESA